MNAIIVPCTQEKIWDTDPAAGRVPAKYAYTRPSFRTWRQYAERSGSPWFILSTKYGLLQPNDLIESYSVSLSQAVADKDFLNLLRNQGIDLALLRFERVILLDWERFEPLVRAALPDQKQYELKRL